MANNILEKLAQMSTPELKRANWNEDFTNVGTNDFGFGKVRLCEEVVAGTNVRLDFKSAYSTNPTISPVFSKARVRVTAIWIPISLYLPAARDNVAIKPGESDFAFPTINFNYRDMHATYSRAVSQTSDVGFTSQDITPLNVVPFCQAKYGHGFDYVPEGSIFAELGMWKPNFQPIGFATTASSFPPPKNAIPLLGYYDYFRTYIMNSQESTAPFRIISWAPGFDYVFQNGVGSPHVASIPSRSAVDVRKTRDEIDNLFKQVRVQGANYGIGDGAFDISTAWNGFLGFPTKNILNRDILVDNDGIILSDFEPVAIPDNHFGEWRDTYRGDRFTSYLSNENVEYERSTARITFDTSGESGYITMEQIYSCKSVQNYVRRSVFKNNGYPDFIEAQYNVTPPTNLTHPLFLGSVATDLYWNDVISQTQSADSRDIESNTNLGSRAALGFGRMVTGSYRGKDDRPFVSFTAKEPGYLMLIETIVPDVSYYQSYNPQYDKLTLESLYFPSFDRDGYQDKQLVHLVEQPDKSFGKFPYIIDYDSYNVAYAQEPAYFEYMTKYSRMSGQMVDSGVYRHWVFSRQGYEDDQLDAQNGTSISFNFFVKNQTTTYVDPEPYNKIFANENGLDNFQCYYSFDLKVFQPLSHRFLSFK